MKNSTFVNHSEALIFLYECGCDEGMSRKAITIDDVLSHLDGVEAVTKIIRIDLETIHAEDVSEVVAEAYLEKNGYKKSTHSFVLKSEAYQNAFAQLGFNKKQTAHFVKYNVWLTDEEVEELEDEEYGTYEQQHRIDASDTLPGHYTRSHFPY